MGWFNHQLERIPKRPKMELTILINQGFKGHQVSSEEEKNPGWLFYVGDEQLAIVSNPSWTSQ